MMPSKLVARPFVLAAFTLGLGTLVATSAGAADTLAWSLANARVMSCTAVPCVVGTTLTVRDDDIRYAADTNASATASDPTYGLAHGYTGAGAGALDLPQLHASATSSNGGGAFGFNYAVLDGVQGYRWAGEGRDLDVSSFVGTLEFTNSAEGYGFVNASLAIITGALRGTALGEEWYRVGPNYGFRSDCSTEGAIAVGSTGVTETKGSVTATVTPTCGAPTFRVETGDEFFVWGRMMAFHAGGGFVDASNTFSVGLSPNLTVDDRLALTKNLIVAPPLTLSVPEPTTWAMMILGFGAVGSVVRRRRAGERVRVNA